MLRRGIFIISFRLFPINFKIYNFDVCTMCVFEVIDSYENVLFCSVVRLV